MVSAAGFEPATHALKGLLQVWCHAVPVCVYMYLRTYAILDTGKNRHSLVTFMVTFFGAPRLARGCGGEAPQFVFFFTNPIWFHFRVLSAAVLPRSV
jgi:hypothetical protein